MLTAADVCPGAGEHCWPAFMAPRLHDAGTPGVVLLAPRVRTRLYVRVPPDGALLLEHADTGVRLVVTARTDSGAPREVYRARDGGSPTWRSARIDLGNLAGKTIRLDLTPVPLPGAPARGSGTRVRRAALAGSAPPAAPRPRLRPGRPNVVVYLVDTLRADRLGCYGAARPASPRLDAFAASSTVFEHAIAASSWTLPSTASLLTGLTPNHHGALELGHSIRADVPTLAETLAAAGWTTAAFVTNYLGSATFGHGRGFGRFHFYPEDAVRRPGFYLPAEAVVRRVEHWLDRRPLAAPFFLYVHVADPHWPYVPPPRFVRPLLPPGTPPSVVHAMVGESRRFFMGNDDWGSRRAELPPDRAALLERLYEGDVRRADAGFGRLLDALARRGLADDTLVVVTSDHGEEFLDHGGLAHGQTLYEEVLHVPLIVRLPHGAGTRDRRLAAVVDVMPTILDAAGIAPPAGLDGRSLLGPPRPDGDEVYATLTHRGFDLESVRGIDWKVIRTRGAAPDDAFEAFDLVHDPLERHDLAETAPVLVGYGARRLREIGAAPHPGPTVDPALLERLRALGYVGR